MRFGFIGGTPRGYSLFQELLQHGYKPEFITILKEDDHENLKVSKDFAEFAEKNGLKSSIQKKLSLSDNETISKLKLDFIIVCGWRTIIDASINDSLTFGMIAAHDSLLPKYRGFAPLNWSIINGERETGVTLFLINDGEVDSGDIISQEKVLIKDEENINDVYSKIIETSNSLYLDFMHSFSQKTPIALIKQNESDATYTCKRTPDDGRINWTDSSITIYNLIRALVYPYTGAFFYYKEQKYIIHSASLGKQNQKIYAGRIPGRVISITDEGVEVLCGEGTIHLKLIEAEDSKNIVSANLEFKSITIKMN